MPSNDVFDNASQKYTNGTPLDPKPKIAIDKTLQNSPSDDLDSEDLPMAKSKRSKVCPFCSAEVLLTAKKCDNCNKRFKLNSSKNSKNSYPKVGVATITILTFITFGAYQLFFLYRVFDELNRRGYTRISPSRAVWSFFIPLYNIAWAFMVWQEIAFYIESEHQRLNLKPPKVALIKYWSIGHFVSLLTCGLFSPFLFIMMVIVFVRTQNYLNKLSINFDNKINNEINIHRKEYSKTKKEDICLVLACISIFFNIFTAIPAIIYGHLALNDFKKGNINQNKKKIMTGLIIGYIFAISSTLIFVKIIYKEIKLSNLTERRELGKAQIKSVGNFSSEYHKKYNKPIQSIEDLLKLNSVSPNLIISPISKIPYVLFTKKNVSPKNYLNWWQAGKIWIYEEIPDSQGQIMFIGPLNLEVQSLPEAGFQNLLKEEIKKYSSP